MVPFLMEIKQPLGGKLVNLDPLHSSRNRSASLAQSASVCGVSSTCGALGSLKKALLELYQLPSDPFTLFMPWGI